MQKDTRTAEQKLISHLVAALQVALEYGERCSIEAHTLDTIKAALQAADTQVADKEARSGRIPTPKELFEPCAIIHALQQAQKFRNFSRRDEGGISTQSALEKELSRYEKLWGEPYSDNDGEEDDNDDAYNGAADEHAAGPVLSSAAYHEPVDY